MPHTPVTLTVHTHRHLSAIGSVAWEELRTRSPSATVFQSYAWLQAWWESFGEGSAQILSVWEAETLVGAAALYVDADGVLRLMGEQHADYGGFLVEADRKQVYHALLKAVWNGTMRWRELIFEAVLLEGPFAQALRAHGAWRQEGTPSPRVLFSGRPAESLLSKDSLKRHAKRLQRIGRVSVEHLQGSQAIEPYLNAFFEQHRARWAGSGTPSLFEKASNQRFYREFTRAALPADLLFTVLKVDERPVAMHWGLRSQGGIIWYKPSFDPAYRQCGPGEVLLSCLIEHAASSGECGIDFTRGDERYKARFASETRYIAAFHARPSQWGNRAAHFGWQVRQKSIAILKRLRLDRAAKQLRQRLRRRPD